MKIVIKVGSNVLCAESKSLDLGLIERLIEQIAALYEKGHEIILITSGAVAGGRGILKNPEAVSKAALAAAGQVEIMNHYHDFFGKHKIKTAQLLLSPNCFKNRARYDALKNTIIELVESRIIPIINENDATTVNDSFRDNDSLASMIAVLFNAERLIFLTNLDGLYSADPNINKDARMIKEVKNVDLAIQKMCSKGKSSLGSGGMLSKLKGAKLAATCGVEVNIINGLEPENIGRLLSENKPLGTRFLAQKSGLSHRKKWLLIGAASQGKIIVDQGARKALQGKNSLLAVGVKDVKGNFIQRDFVNIADQKGEIFALGIVNYGSCDLSKIKGLKDKDSIKKICPREVVHMDNLTLLK
ncbi:MAG: glutamate 5-kinase [Candidatus Pacebacteria bacterium]|nr:glutamate 5-kinase [Candidatus Paceibacterota bacterium]